MATPVRSAGKSIILWSGYWGCVPSGQEIKLDGEEYLIVKEDEVLAVIEDKTEQKPAVLKGQTKKKTKKTTTKKSKK